MKKATFFLGHAGVRYWEDAFVNDVEDTDGTLIPGRVGDDWCVKIDIATGTIIDWPQSTTADIHYKVCDAGEYWLLDAEGNKIAGREGYVPGDFLCHGDNGFGDYIILKVGHDGKIASYERPEIVPEDWTWAAA
ncbi:hypothetical protein CK227_10335 [Mesorhizobium sp. WSM4308]|uniref:hypothetical protein n=1 Tax=Mesorhizobium sp. WSM4308 TaxID=2029409 RepID=UPI000BB00F25|nr:hypothetical protein [Mesorhizobium sp. WSM4308]PBB75181.1 hypothetical protein CK227_10335 [Mesorhizobium sp. WSM4308]